MMTTMRENLSLEREKEMEKRIIKMLFKKSRTAQIFFSQELNRLNLNICVIRASKYPLRKHRCHFLQNLKYATYTRNLVLIKSAI